MAHGRHRQLYAATSLWQGARNTLAEQLLVQQRPRGALATRPRKQSGMQIGADSRRVSKSKDGGKHRLFIISSFVMEEVLNKRIGLDGSKCACQ